MKRIIFIDEGRGIGGAERNLVTFLSFLDKSKFEPIVILSCRKKLYEILNNLGIKTAIINSPPFLSSSLDFGRVRILNPVAIIYDLLIILIKSLKLYLYLSNNSIFVLQTNGIFEHIYGGIASKAKRISCIWYMQDIPTSRVLSCFKKMIWNMLATLLAPKVVVVSKAVSEIFKRQVKDKIQVIYPGLELSRYKTKSTEEINCIKSKWSLQDAEYVIGMTSRLVYWKGHVDFINAAKVINGRLPRTKFIIAGSPIFGKKFYLKKLKDLSKHLGIKDKIVFTGFIDDITEILSIIDVFVQPSVHSDPCPLTVLEAGALRRAIVATRTGGIPEIIKDGQEGILVEPNNPEALANAVIKLIESSEQRRLFGEAICKKINSEFDMKDKISNFENLYINSLP